MKTYKQLKLSTILYGIFLLFVMISNTSISSGQYIAKRLFGPDLYRTYYLFNKEYCYRITSDTVAMLNLDTRISSYYESKQSDLQVVGTTIFKDSIYSLMIPKPNLISTLPSKLGLDTLIICKFVDNWKALDTIIIKGETRYHKLVVVKDTLHILLWCYDSVAMNSVLYKIVNNKIGESKYLQYSNNKFIEMDNSTFINVGDYAFYSAKYDIERHIERRNLLTNKTDTLKIDGSPWVEYNSLQYKNGNLYILNSKGIYKSIDYGDSWTSVLFADSLKVYGVNDKEDILYFNHQGYHGMSMLARMVTDSKIDTINFSVSDTQSPSFWSSAYNIYTRNDKFFILTENGLFEVINEGNTMITETTPTLIDFDRITKVEIFDVDGRLINILYDARSLFNVCQGLRNICYCVFHFKDGIFLKPYYFN